MNTTTLPYLNTATSRPSPEMSDNQWQELFLLLKITTQPSKQKSISTNNSHTAINYYTNTYRGDTLDQNWRKVLNDNLKQIRSGGYDYVYYIYNIVELLKYECERLRSRYNQDEQYFEIWLDK